MTQSISQQRCFNHLHREAVAQCLECRRFFCRECVTAHDDRVVCAACLEAIMGNLAKRKTRARGAGLAVRIMIGFLFLWFVFFYIGRLLLLLPTSFHEGSLWRETPWDQF